MKKIFTKKINVALAAMLCCALWGSAFPVIKIGYNFLNIAGSDTSSQILFAGIRFFLAGFFTILLGSIFADKFIVIKKKGNNEEDLYLRTLELAQVQEDEYFGHVVSKDLTSILHDIRDTHRKDATTADENCVALEVQKQLQDAMDYKGSTEEKKARLFLANLGIDYDALTMEQFANLIEVLKLSKHMNSPISQRGKGSMTHGKGKKKKGKDRHSMDDLAGKGKTAILRLFYKKRRKKYYEALY